MDASAMILFCAIVFVASIIQGVSGFAFGLIVLMVFPHIFGYTSALAITNLMALFLLAYNGYLYRKFANWSWIPLGVAASATMDLVGILVLKHVGDSPVWHTLMGVMFIVMAIYLLWGQNRIQFHPTKLSLVICMGISGLIMGMFVVGGPIAAAFFLAATKSKEEYLGTLQIISVFGVLIDVILRLVNGMYTFELVKFAAIGVVFMVTGLLIARKFVSRMDALTLRRVVCAVMAIDGLVMLLR